MDPPAHAQDDPHIQAQELIKCDLCNIQMVQVHCNTCHVKVCNACIGEHMASDESKKIHEIIKFIFLKSIPIYPLCMSHDKGRCEIYCQDCDKPVCNTCITSDQHSGHQILKILKVKDERKANIIKEQNELNDVIYPKYQEMATDVEKLIEHLENGYGGLSKFITEHGEKWHQEIDRVVMKLTAEVDEMKNKQLKTLQKRLEEINEKISEIKKEIKVIDDLIDSQDISELFSINFNVDEYRKLPQKIVLSFPEFTPGTIQGEELCNLFGTLLPSKTTSERHGYRIKKIQKSSEAGSSLPVKQLLDEPEILTTINTEYMKYLYHVVSLSDDEIWTRGDTSTMKLFSVHQGSLLKSITTKSGSIPTDIAITKQGNLVFIDPLYKTVYIVLKNGMIETLITLQKEKPCNICSTLTGDLLVVMNNDDIRHQESKIVRYSGSTEKRTIQPKEEGKPLYFSSPKCISENKNLDICVADYKAVVVFNLNGRLRFRFTGKHAQNSQLFYPVGITTDSQSHILIADQENHCVHIIDQYGQFLCYIKCGQNSPRGLCIDTNDNLYVALEMSKQVKKIKYMEGN